MDGLALLIVDKPPANVRALEAATIAAQVGASVVVAGYPVSVGAFSVLPATVVSVQGTEVFLAPVISEGFSGGPVMLDGRVAGVVFGRGEFGRAVPAALLDVYLRGLDVPWSSDAPKAEAKAGAARENSKDGLKYVWIPPGTFRMGCSRDDGDCWDDEVPAREATISRGFWMGATEVTQAAYQRVMGTNPSHFNAAQRPVDSVNGRDAREYCGRVGLRLPTEEEWEYAARAGSGDARYDELDDIAWYQGNSGGHTHEVAQKQPNLWGLYDMLGNVYEWTSSLRADQRALRGGSWGNGPRSIRASFRFWGTELLQKDIAGFRCAGDLR